MIDAVIQGPWVFHRINRNIGDDFLPLLAFLRHATNVIFLECSNEGRLSLNNLGIRNIPSDVC